MGSTTLIKFFPFDKIKNIEINYSNDSKVVLKIDAFSNSQKLAFDEKGKNKIENLIAIFYKFIDRVFGLFYFAYKLFLLTFFYFTYIFLFV